MRGAAGRSLWAIALVAAFVWIASPPTVHAADVDPAAVALAERHAPLVQLQAQEEPCDTDGEAFEPMDVEALLGNPQILLRQVGESNPVMGAAPAASDVFDLGEGFYLDFPGNALAPGCIYERDFHRYSEGRRPTVYAHVAQQADRPDLLALQYWFYWYYNDWNNKHEGDWEGIQLLFEAPSVAAALSGPPVSVGYAQHEGGERADWDDDKLERRGSRPVVWPSAGSHASYFDSGLYLGRSASEGFGCDDTAGTARLIDPTVVVLPDSVDDPDDPLAWVAFEGRWGERQAGPFNGPTGPAQKDRWERPVDWHDDLRSSSVSIPGGTDAAPPVVEVFCGAVGWGSAQLVTFKEHPGEVTLALVVAIALLMFLARRTSWAPVQPLPLARRRRLGQLSGAAGRLFRLAPTAFLVVSLVYVPVAFAAGLLSVVVRKLPVAGALVESDGGNGLVGTFVSLVLGGLGHVVGFSLAIASIAALAARIERGESVSVSQALREVGERAADLVGALLAGAAIVLALLVSIVGIPWGVRQLVRYQFVPQVTALEGLRGRDALRRSGRLVRGRWPHTAMVMVLVNLLIGVIATGVGLIVLLLVTDAPLWLVSGVVAAVPGLVVPVAAAAVVLLYGDAVAEHAGHPPAARVSTGTDDPVPAPAT